MNQIIITAPTVDDIDTMWKWGEENWELWGDEKNKWFTRESLQKEIQNPGNDVLLIARDGDTSIGMCLFNVMQNWTFCFGLFVEKEYRGKGIGKRLLKQGEKELKKQNITNYCLLVDTNNPEAIRFYQREGFYQGYEFIMMTKDLRK